MKEKTSPWVYVGVGCAVLAVALVCAIGVMGYLGYRWGRQIEADMQDPAVRSQKAKEILGCEALPEGYHAVLGFTIPFVTRVALLGDRESDSEGKIGKAMERGFFYVETFGTGQDKDAVRGYFEGRTDDRTALRRRGLRLDVDGGEVVGRGVIEGRGQTLMYVSQRGRVRFWREDHDEGPGSTEGILSLVLVECPHDQRQRLAAWFGPDPAPGGPLGADVLTGTPADKIALGDFMAHFRLCGEAPLR